MIKKEMRPTSDRVLRGLLVATLVLLTAQGWFGDFVNIFVAPANGTPPPPPTLGGLAQAVASLEPAFFLEFHAYGGIALFLLAAVIVVLVFRFTYSPGVRAWSALGLLSVVSAAFGGFLFVRSGFSDGGGSAQMGGSFIASYACYFMTLYCSKYPPPARLDVGSSGAS